MVTGSQGGRISDESNAKENKFGDENTIRDSFWEKTDGSNNSSNLRVLWVYIC